MNFLLLQINDSLFPIGGYIHSFGLESYIQLGSIKTKQDALRYVISNLNTQILYTDLLAIKLIFSSGKNLEEVLRIEEYINISSSPKELREGCLKLGQRFIKTIQAMQLKKNMFFESYAQKTQVPVHASAYGVFCMSYDIDIESTIKHYMYAQASNIITNCVKIIPLSQNDGQAILSSLHQEFDLIYLKLQDLDWRDFCNASIHNDIKAMQHEILYSRLYMS